jgi:spermidine/putrescine-binding protein
VAGLLAVLALAGCGERLKNPDTAETHQIEHHPAPDTEKHLTLLVRQDYLDHEIVANFRKQYGVTVEVENFETNEEMLQRLKRGGKCDIIIASGSALQESIQRGYLLEIDHLMTTRLKLAPAVLERIPFDPDRKYSIPYTWRTLGLGFISEQETEIPRSWKVLFEPELALAAKLKDKISMFNEPRYVMGSALLYLGLSPNTTNRAEIKRAGDLLLQQRPLVAEYSAHAARQELASGESYMDQALSSDIAIASQINHRIRFAIPKEGSFLFVDLIALPVNCEDKELAALFVKYLLRPEIAARFPNHSFCASALFEADPEVLPDVRNSPAYTLPDEDAKTFFIQMVDEETRKFYYDVWKGILSGHPSVITGAPDVENRTVK